MRGTGHLRRGARLAAGSVGVLVLLRLVGCADPSGVAGPTGADRHAVPSAGSLAAVTSTVTLVGAADIASCSSNQGDEKTAAIINNLLLSDPTATVFAAGDVVYDNATATEFTNCYNPSWGAFKANTRPALGNRRVQLGARPILRLLRVGRRRPQQGVLQLDLGTWHIIVLNSNIEDVGRSAQLLWLSADLAATSQPCVLAYWHHARFASR